MVILYCNQIATEPENRTEPSRRQPAQTLPFDILAEIFLRVRQPAPDRPSKPRRQQTPPELPHTHSEPDEDPDDGAPQTPSGNNRLLSPREAPLLLCHVCRSWRAAALEIPALWDGVYLPITYSKMAQPLRAGAAHGPSHFKSTAGARGGSTVQVMADSLDQTSGEIVEWWERTFLRRSTSDRLFCDAALDSASSSVLWAPSILVREKHVPQEEAESRRPLWDGALFPLTRFFASTFFRMSKRIELDVLNRDVLQSMHAAPAHATPFIHLVELRINRLTYLAGHRDTELTFPPSPALRHLAVSNHRLSALFYDAKSRPLFPWPQLRRLSLSDHIVDSAFKVLLETCAQLDILAVNLYRYDKPNPERVKAVMCVPSPRRLILGCNVYSGYSPLEGFVFPNVTSLRVVPLDNSGFEDLNRIVLLLHATPNLEEFDFEYASVAFSIESDASLPSERRLSALVPHLKLLILKYIESAGASTASEDILEFLHSEWMCFGWPVAEGPRSLEMHFTPHRSNGGEDAMLKVRDHFAQSQVRHPVFDSVTVHRVPDAEQKIQQFNIDNLDKHWGIG
ncbi:hypothetical protein CVT26_000402 [Gymnopilus dilepis]|uniref:Uncharacterized protein n=1 Tax=Gymnopilus dilepis TaxID=231916 RepID=A0A409VHT4_9AGAR|nr:hypothetical protein CVT26_000402 [Gymnopilus dilepis]